MDAKQKSITTTLLVAGLIGMAVFGLFLRLKQPLASAEKTRVAGADSTLAESLALRKRGKTNGPHTPESVNGPSAKRPGPSLSGSVNSPDPLTEVEKFYRLFDKLFEPQTTFAQRQQIWSQIKEAGLLDQAIAELERRTKDNPDNADFPASLGYGYLQKAATVSEIADKGILGLRADQVFDNALKLDSKNWEARFMKAVAMSYWPPELNKWKDTMGHFIVLIEQQEVQPTQPEFAQTYVQLGNLYQKQGFPDYARQTWERGATLFPNEPTLKEKLSVQR